MVSELSILIPAYNRPVFDLVQALVQQANHLPIPIEIRVYDDGSSHEIKLENRGLLQLPGVVYQELPNNVGRSKIRHALAQGAAYKTLLFLDNDVLPAQEDFLEKYIQWHAGAVTVGGICYAEIPSNVQWYLRWLYGKNREQATAVDRQKNPYARVFLSNLLVEKNLFIEWFQEEAVRQYGHEDTLFAQQLQQQQIPVLHIDNPVQHLGLETATVFLEKTNAALQNLVTLHKNGLLKQESGLWKWHERLAKTGILQLLHSQKSWLVPQVKKNLTSKKPSLWVFDLYRLMQLHHYLKS